MAALLVFARSGFFTDTICNRHAKAKFTTAHHFEYISVVHELLESAILNRTLVLQFKTTLPGCVPSTGLCVSSTAVCNFAGLCTGFIAIESGNPYFTNVARSRNMSQCWPSSMWPYGVTWEQSILISGHNQSCGRDTGSVLCQSRCTHLSQKQGSAHRQVDVAHHRTYILESTLHQTLFVDDTK